MTHLKSGQTVRPSGIRQFGFMALCLAALVCFLFREAFLPDYTVFSNDGPLGAISSKAGQVPGTLFGLWQDLNWLGGAGPSAVPSLSLALGVIFGPLGVSKIFAPFAIFFVGMCAWFCFRQWKFSPVACILGGLAASLNSDFFSTACWGVASHPIAFGCDFLALAALADESGRKRWIKVALAGMAVGMSLMETIDIGAIFSLFIALFAIFQAWTTEGAPAQKLLRGLSRLAVVVVCAAFIAAGALSTIFVTQIQGMAGNQKDQEAKPQGWGWATQWSLPKREVLSLVVPGLFGFRMDTPDGGNYWGACGRDLAWDSYFKGGPLQDGAVVRISFPANPKLDSVQQIGSDGKLSLPLVGELKAAGSTPEELEKQAARLLSGKPEAQEVKITREPPDPNQAFIRYGGGGIYTGVVVVLIALWAVFQSFRTQNGIFSERECKFILFWASMAFISILLGFGRFAPFYQFFYAIPKASIIRNPAKFFHVANWILVILFGYGVYGLSRRYLEAPVAVVRDLSSQLKFWWAKAPASEKKWVNGSFIMFAASLIGWGAYAWFRSSLAAYLQEVQFGSELANEIAAFSVRQVGWFILFLALGIGLLTLILSGYFGGKRWKIGAVLLGLLVTLDLGRADLPWVITYEWRDKYASNPVIDMLREKPYENRVSILPFRPPDQVAVLNQLYESEWKQQLFQYYNIQSLNIVQMSRLPLDYVAFETALGFDGTSNSLHHITRRWQLTNTRFLLGAAGYLNLLNQQLDPTEHRFRIVAAFDIVPKPGVSRATRYTDLTAVLKPEGPYALFEFTGALPRAKLYSNWQVSTNDQATLQQLAAPDFDPGKVVFVADPIPAAAGGTNQNAGTVEIREYAPKRIVLQAKAASPSVLLLNNKFDPNWKVMVDGRPQTLLRCNYVMQGVQVPQGEHVVEFQFTAPPSGLYISFAAILVSLGLIGFLAISKSSEPGPVETEKPGRPSAPRK